MKEPFRSRPPIRRPEVEDDQIVDGEVEEEALALIPLEGPDEIPLPHDAAPSHSLRRQLLAVRVPGPGLLALALALLAAGVFFTLLNVATLPDDVANWWPMATLAAAGLWSLVALLRRDARSFLGGASAAGLSVSFLLDVQDVAPLEETVVGVILITLGVAIMVRGLLMRPPRSV